MFCLKTPYDVNKLEYINKLNADLLMFLFGQIKTGISTIELEETAEKFCEKNKVIPAFKGYNGFPFCLCVSINDEIIHGFPSERILLDTDIVSVDCGLIRNGYYSDAAFTRSVKKISERTKQLLYTTELALYNGIYKARVNNRLNDISKAIYDTAISNGFDVVKDFVGHGTGFELHELPKIPNYVGSNTNWRLRPGMVLAIEPMFVDGDVNYKYEKNRWTVKTVDGSLSAHFEHTIVILEEGPKILTEVDIYKTRR